MHGNDDGGYTPLMEQSGRRRLQAVHNPLISRLRKGDSHALSEAKGLVEQEVEALRTEVGAVDPDSTDPMRIYLSLQRVRGRAHAAAQLTRVLLMETQGGAR